LDPVLEPSGITIFFVPVSFVSTAQNPDRLLSAYFEEARSGKNQSIPKNLLIPQNAKTTLSLLSSYLKDSSRIVRSKAHSITSLRTERWAALLALARMGDSYATDDIMRRVGKK
jgi:hypothetical protein